MFRYYFLNRKNISNRSAVQRLRSGFSLTSLFIIMLTLLSSVSWAQEEEFMTGGTPTIDDSRCETPDVLLMLDRSGSMLDDMKWEQATTALSEAFAPYFNVLRFGLLTFPTEGACGVVETPLAIPVGEAEGMDLDAIYESVLPNEDALTPLADSINAGKRALDAVKVPNRRGFLILLTDGIETCAPIDVEDSAPIEAARLAAEAGYTVYVIGFGSLVRRNVLLQMAEAGGTGNARLVSDQASLEMTLNEIVNSATTEQCDLLDNDCDGRVDEGADCAPPCYPELGECPCTSRLDCNLGESCEGERCAPVPCQLECDQGYICRQEECISVASLAMGGETAGEIAGAQAGSGFAGTSNTGFGGQTSFSMGGTTLPPASNTNPDGGMATTPSEGCQLNGNSASVNFTLMGLLTLLISFSFVQVILRRRQNDPNQSK